MALNPMLLEVLACPEDRQSLLYFADEEALYNPRLKIRYPIRAGIPVMLQEESETVSDDEHARLMAKASVEGVPSTLQVSP